MRWEDYLRELGRARPLEPEEEAVLWQRSKERGDAAARRRIIESYQPLVFRVAFPYRGMPQIMDILQEGTVGLIEAVERYDPLRGVAFRMFAAHRIRGRMQDFLRREGCVDIPCIGDPCHEPEGSWESALPDPAASVPEQAEANELALRLRQALGRLPLTERTVLEGIYLRDEEAKDVAEDLEMSLSHIYRLQKKGIRRVRGMLSKFMQQWRQ